MIGQDDVLRTGAHAAGQIVKRRRAHVGGQRQAHGGPHRSHGFLTAHRILEVFKYAFEFAAVGDRRADRPKRIRIEP